MKMNVPLVLLVVAGIAAGAGVGFLCARRPVAERPIEETTSPEPAPAEQVMVEPVPAKAPPVDVAAVEFRRQELEAAKAYLAEPLESAQQSLEELLESYDRLEDPQGASSDSIAMGKAMTHARLARIRLGEGDPEGYLREVDLAMELSGDLTEESLFQKLDRLDQAQRRELGSP